MNTNTKAIHPEKKINHSVRNILLAIITVIMALVAVAVIADNMTNRPVVVAENSLNAPFSNALEMQYAQPWLDAQSKSVVAYGNALEAQYAQPWIEAQAPYSNALELQYAQPFLQGTENLSIPVTGPIDCQASLEMFYACQNVYGRP